MNCSKCEYSHTLETFENEPTRYHCEFNPPVVHPDGITRWPVVMAADSCGQIRWVDQGKLKDRFGIIVGFL